MTDVKERPKMVTAAQAARQIGVCRETVKRWARSGTLPGVKNLSGHWYFSQDVIDDLPVLGGSDE